MSTLEDSRCPDCGTAGGGHTDTCPQYTGPASTAPVVETIAPTPAATTAPTPAGLDFAVILANVRELIEGYIGPLKELVSDLHERLKAVEQKATPAPTSEPAPPTPTPEATREADVDAAITETETTPPAEPETPPATGS